MRLEEKAGARSSRGFERCVKKFEYLSQARGISSQVINAGEEGVILQKDHTGCRTETRPVMITEHLIGSESQSWFLRLHFLFLLPCTGEGNSNPLQCSCLENPRDGGAWWAAVYGVAQSWTQLKRLSSSSSSSSSDSKAQPLNRALYCLQCLGWDATMVGRLDSRSN